MKRYAFSSLVLLLVFHGYAWNMNPATWFATQQERHLVTVVNDLPDLMEFFPQETEELQESIYYDVYINGVHIAPDQKKIIPVFNKCCVITVKSRKKFHEHLKNVSPKVKKAIERLTSWMDTYYGLVCNLSDENEIHLALPVSHGCQSLKDGKPARISYKWPWNICIWLKEAVDLKELSS